MLTRRCHNRRSAAVLVTLFALLTTPLLEGADGMANSKSTRQEHLLFRTCSICGDLKARTDFYRQPRRKDRLFPYCKKCSDHKATTWRRNNPEATREIRERSILKNPLRYKETHLKSQYGLTRVEYEAMLQAQGGLCAIAACGRRIESRFTLGQSLKTVACVDHEHQTGRIRSLLCQRCNYVVGCVEAHPGIVAEATAYLGLHRV